MSLGYHLRVLGSLAREALKRRTRSPRWRTVEKAHLRAHPVCAACPGTKRLQVHHIKPFHVHPELELNPANLITLCMGPQECHLRIGHRGSWKDDNPCVEGDAALLKKAWQP